jgi:hypothetical protein
MSGVPRFGVLAAAAGTGRTSAVRLGKWWACW